MNRSYEEIEIGDLFLRLAMKNLSPCFLKTIISSRLDFETFSTERAAFFMIYEIRVCPTLQM